MACIQCQAVVEKFSDGDLLEAMQVLWDHCHDSLEKLGVEFVRRRASEISATQQVGWS